MFLVFRNFPYPSQKNKCIYAVERILESKKENIWNPIQYNKGKVIGYQFHMVYDRGGEEEEEEGGERNREIDLIFKPSVVHGSTWQS
jgi:hypothetical protein